MHRLTTIILSCALSATAQAQSAFPQDTVTPITVVARPLEIPLDATRSIAPLALRAAFELSAQDKRFGGFSALTLSRDGQRFLAISDAGTFFTGDLSETAQGQLQGLTNTVIFPLLGPDGKAFKSKSLADSEAISLSPTQDTLYVSFEYRHRVWAYPLENSRFESLSFALPTALNAAPALAHLPPNGGIEAMAYGPDAALLLMSEEGAASGSGRQSWRFRQGVAQPFTYLNPEPHVPTDAVMLNDHQILVLNRHFSPTAGASAVLSWIEWNETTIGNKAKAHIIARFNSSFPVDNFEGLAMRHSADGQIDLFILSDDNFNPAQRTLLLQLRLDPKLLTVE